MYLKRLVITNLTLFGEPFLKEKRNVRVEK